MRPENHRFRRALNEWKRNGDPHSAAIIATQIYVAHAMGRKVIVTLANGARQKEVLIKRGQIAWDLSGNLFIKGNPLDGEQVVKILWKR